MCCVCVPMSCLWYISINCPHSQGDVGREFLGKRPLPYNQFFRVDLVKSTSDPGTLFDLTNLHVSHCDPYWYWTVICAVSDSRSRLELWVDSAMVTR